MPKHYNNLAQERLEHLIREYLDEYCLIESGLSDKTIKNKKHTLIRLQNFLQEKGLNVESCRAYTKHLYKLKWKNVSIGADLKIIKAFINYLFSRKYIAKSWAPEILLPKVNRTTLDIIPAKLAEKVILAGSKPCKNDHCLHRKSKREHRVALQFILRTGLRLSELINLKAGDINFENQTYNVLSKGGNIDILPLPVDMLNKLRKRNKNKHIFNVTPNTLNICLKRGCKRLRIHSKLTVHTLRHIFCTELLKNGVPLQVVSRLMRHSSVKITDSVYSHYLIEDLMSAINNYHPLVRSNLPINDILNYLDSVVKKTGIFENSNFSVNRIYTEDRYVIDITRI